MEEDPFASAVTDEALLHCDALTIEILGADVNTASLGGSSKAGDVQTTPIRNLPTNPKQTAKERKPRSKGPETSDLVLALPPEDQPRNLWLTLFINPTLQSSDDPADRGRKPKRQKQGDSVPVTMWPQYRVKGESITFAVVAPTEHWLIMALAALRGRGSKANTTRILNKNFAHAVRILLREGLHNHGRNNADSGSEDEIDTEDEADAAAKTKAKARTFSGFKLGRVFLLKTVVAKHDVTLVNYGKLFILQLDDEGIVFLNNVILDIMQKLSDTTEAVDDSKSVVSEVAAFRFDHTTPNVRDKVLWEPNQNAWKLILMEKNKPKRAAFADEQGDTLKVPERLSAVEHEFEKAKSYARAILAWNSLDASGRKRIAQPLQIQLQPPSSSSASDSQDGAEPDAGAVPSQKLSLQSKWEMDGLSLQL